MSLFFTNKLLEDAYVTVCRKRSKYNLNDDIWDLRHNWETQKTEILNKLNNGSYRFDTVRKIKIDKENYEIWTAKDAVVIETLTLLLKEKYNITQNCSSYHLKGKGGIKAAVGKIRRNKKKFKYVMRTDVKKYYASINHDRLFDIVKKYCKEALILSLIYQFMKRTVCFNGFYRTARRGICRGSSLSPLFGAIYLEELDTAMNDKNSFYIRYMDDIIIMTKNRWSFRRSISKVNSIFEKLSLSQAIDKTFIGKIERGFDFLGFYFNNEGMTISKKSVRKFAENVVMRLKTYSDSADSEITPVYRMQYSRNSSVYDVKQLRDKNNTKGDLLTPDTVSLYTQRWTTWVKSIYGKSTKLFSSTP